MLGQPFGDQFCFFGIVRCCPSSDGAGVLCGRAPASRPSSPAISRRCPSSSVIAPSPPPMTDICPSPVRLRQAAMTDGALAMTDSSVPCPCGLVRHRHGSIAACTRVQGLPSVIVRHRWWRSSRGLVCCKLRHNRVIGHSWPSTLCQAWGVMMATSGSGCALVRPRAPEHGGAHAQAAPQKARFQTRPSRYHFHWFLIGRAHGVEGHVTVASAGCA